MFKTPSLHEAFQSVKQVAQPDLHVSVASLYNLIQLCVNDKSLYVGRKVHSLIVECGYESNPFLASHMIRLFSVCGNLAEANQVFEKVQEPDVFAWNAIISAHTKLGNNEQALSFYNQLNNFGFSLDAHIFVAVLKACHSLVHLLLIHAQLIECGLYSGIYIPVTLLDVYTKYANVEEVINIFNSLQERTVVAWNAVIKGCNHHQHTDESLQFFLQMQTEGIFPTHVTFITVVKTCSDAAALSQGKIIHSQVLACGLNSNVTVHNTLIDMYAKCARLDDAYRMFCSHLTCDVVTWNAMIAGFVQHGHVSNALGVFQDMQHTCVEPNEITFSTAVKACCSSVIHSEIGMLLHGIIIQSGLEMNLTCRDRKKCRSP
ncbi:hypothetical protein GOP47_0021689 [Adiantum capillus-veneris]|uniref:Pentatricopeptide repeat-containing protein n=1 Tax=Adiantum capillus-veneris TaxID=13818 RepID=A0A9D4Z769_ADICA|nr:hypothetical protein GOP47_0021689 [Adiantum capillus-veneris]